MVHRWQVPFMSGGDEPLDPPPLVDVVEMLDAQSLAASGHHDGHREGDTGHT